MKKWDKSEYQRISHAAFRDGQLLVRFQDSSRVSIDGKSLLPPGSHRAAWNELKFDPYEIVVPVDGKQFEIPWSALRSRSDADYRAHLDKMAEERSNLVGARLRRLREARGLSSKDVAERAGISAQSLSRIENGRHDVVFTTLQKILLAMRCTLRDLAEIDDEREVRRAIESESTSSLESMDELVEKAGQFGVSTDLLETRILPPPSFGSTAARLKETVDRLCLLFDCSAMDIARGTVGLRLTAVGAFKLPKRQASLKTKAYAIYAHQLCKWTRNCSRRRFHAMSDTEFVDTFRLRCRVPTFETLLEFVWSIGIPVLPLADAGAFHGACWLVEDQPVIVLKQRTQYHARWLFDLAHEVGHVIRHLASSEQEVLDLNEITPIDDDDPIEESANDFAHGLLLRHSQERLISEVIVKTGGLIPRFKKAVVEVAAGEGVPVDLLANYLAYRLALQDVSWWGTAQNLQCTEPDPLQVARHVFRSKVDLTLLKTEERDLLEQALVDLGTEEEIN
jgi:transcriptional regulator with XRE-family HTH domain/Zn-dependent peptidase ImmA (M78 family)